MAYSRQNGDTNVTVWLDKEAMDKLEAIRATLQQQMGFAVHRGDVLKYVISKAEVPSD